MNKKPSAASRCRFQTVGRYAVMASLTLGLGQAAMAQSQEWDFTFSFNGSGTLPVSQTSYGQFVGAPADPTLQLSMTGTGVQTAVFDGFLGYNVNSTITTTASISQPNMVSPSSSPYSPTTDSKIVFTTPEYPSYLPLGFQYPPSDDTEYSANPAPGNQENFQYDPSTVLFVQFNGQTDYLILGTDNETQSGTVLTDTYMDSEVILPADIGENDPDVDFLGTVVLTTIVPAATAPDSSTGVVGTLALLGVCAAGAFKKKALTA